MARRLDFDPTPIIDEYKSGVAIKALAAKYGMARDTIRSRIVAAGVPLRSASDQMFVMHLRMTPEARATRALRAQAAVRGSRKSDASMCRAAARRQLVGAMTANERLWQDALMAEGVATVPQYAVDRFNIDLAVPDVRMAIEIQCGWHSSAAKKPADARKLAALTARGWELFEVWGTKVTTAMAAKIAHQVAVERDRQSQSTARD